MLANCSNVTLLWELTAVVRWLRDASPWGLVILCFAKSVAGDGGQCPPAALCTYSEWVLGLEGNGMPQCPYGVELFPLSHAAERSLTSVALPCFPGWCTFL